MVSVNKGQWDRSRGPDANHDFNRAWLAAAQRVLKPNGSIWVSGTAHVIHSVGFALQQLGFKLLNDITWVKPNPPPNLSCRYFTHATETLIWAAKNKRSRHTFHYQEMRRLAGGKQMKSVWEIRPPEPWEKRFGKHPTQKPVALLERILLASSSPGDLVLDPFMGSGTTAVACLRLRRCIITIDREQDCADLAQSRVVAELVSVQVFVAVVQNDLDPCADPVDRSDRRHTRSMALTSSGKLVQRERKFYFVAAEPRKIVFTVDASDLADAWRKFHSSSRSSQSILFVIKTETEIYLTPGT